MNTIFVLIDGLGDVSIPELQYKTPLQYANTKNLDKMSRHGINGLFDAVEPGIACGSDTAHLSMFGYDPKIFYKGRGAFESVGSGIDVSPGDIAFKSNFSFMDLKNKVVLRRRADRDLAEDGSAYCEALDGIKVDGFPDFSVNVKYATEHRCGVRIRHCKYHLSHNISGTDPLSDNLKILKCVPLDPNPTEIEIRTCDYLNALSLKISEILSNHPLSEKRKSQNRNYPNSVLLRGAGVCLDVEPIRMKFKEFDDFQSVCVAPTSIIWGLCKNIGFDVCYPTRHSNSAMTGDYKSNIKQKFRTIVDSALRSQGSFFGFVHIKMVDDAGHDKDFRLKVKCIELIDEALDILINGLASDDNRDWVVAITADHSTSSIIGDHSCEPVPFVMCSIKDFLSESPPFDEVQEFSEIAASKGLLGRFHGPNLLPLFKNFQILKEKYFI